MQSAQRGAMRKEVCSLLRSLAVKMDLKSESREAVRWAKKYEVNKREVAELWTVALAQDLGVLSGPDPKGLS